MTDQIHLNYCTVIIICHSGRKTEGWRQEEFGEQSDKANFTMK